MKIMFAKINFHDEFYQKLKLLVLPITMQQFMLALVSATDAIMLGAGSQTSLCQRCLWQGRSSLS